jgi:hypothetical protein
VGKIVIGFFPAEFCQFSFGNRLQMGSFDNVAVGNQYLKYFYTPVCGENVYFQGKKIVSNNSKEKENTN